MNEPRQMISVTRRFEFAYAHQLPGYMGKCKNMHGHNAVLEIELGMDVASFQLHAGYTEQGDAYTNQCGHGLLYRGMVMDFNDIKDLVNPIIEQLDHSILNESMSTFCMAPTAEMTCLFFASRIMLSLNAERRPQELLRVRVYETSNSFAEWRA